MSCLIFFIAKRMPMSVMLTYVPEKRGEVHSERKLSTLSLSRRNEIFPRWPGPARLLFHFQLCGNQGGKWANLAKHACPQVRRQDWTPALLGDGGPARCSRSFQALETFKEGGHGMPGAGRAWLSTPRQRFCGRGTLNSSRLWMFGSHLVPGGSIPKVLMWICQ